MVISADWRTARKLHRCGECFGSIEAGERYVSAFGYARRGDRPYRLALHPGCVGAETLELAGTDPLVARAWRDAQAAAAAPAEDRPHA